MKSIYPILLAGALASPLHALDPGALSAVAMTFKSASPEAQYQARVELDALIDPAAAPGKSGSAELTKAIIDVVSSPDTPVEAKKYLLRGLARVGDASAVAPMAALCASDDAMLAEEARQVLMFIPGAASVSALEAALATASDSRAKMGLLDALAMQGSPSSVGAVAQLLSDSDVEVGQAAVRALAKIGGAEAVAALKAASQNASLKPDAARALLLVAADDAVVSSIYQSEEPGPLKTAALVAMFENADQAAAEALVKAVLKSQDSELRALALAVGIRSNMSELVGGLPAMMEKLPLNERVVILSNLASVKPAEPAIRLALSRMKSEEDIEKVATLNALAELGSKPAFEAVLAALDDRSPAVNQTAGNVLSKVDDPGAEAALMAGVKSGDVTAIKAVAFRHVDGANASLIDLIKSNQQPAAKEALRTIYSTANAADLKALAAAGAASGDPRVKKRIDSICKRIAKNLDIQ